MFAGLIFEAAMSAHERHRSLVRFYPPTALIMGINMLTPLCLCGPWMCFGIGFYPPTCPLGRRQLGGTTSAPRAHPSSVIARRVDDLCVGHSYCEAKLWPDTNLGHTCAAAIYIAARTPIERWALMFI